MSKIFSLDSSVLDSKKKITDYVRSKNYPYK